MPSSPITKTAVCHIGATGFRSADDEGVLGGVGIERRVRSVARCSARVQSAAIKFCLL